MRVAVITDIHANLAALEAVLEFIDGEDVDRIYCGGDLVGYGPRPNEVCAVIEERRIPTIYGNYDYAIARDLEDCGCAYVDRHDREIGQQSVDWTLAHTDRKSKDFMRGLPFDLRFELGSKRVRLVHGSPRKVNEYLFEDKPARLYERLAAAEDAELIDAGERGLKRRQVGVDVGDDGDALHPTTLRRLHRQLLMDRDRTQFTLKTSQTSARRHSRACRVARIVV